MSDDVESRERIVRAGHQGSGIAQWSMLLAPIAAAFAQQQLSYAFVPWSCHHARVLVHLPTVLALVITIGAAVFANRTLHRAGVAEAGDERSSDARARYMAVSALLMCAFGAALNVGLWLPTLFIHPCQR